MTALSFLRPEWFLLLVPAAAVWWRTRDPERPTRAVRAIALLLLVAALAAPAVRTAAPGRDLVIVADRSRSMPAGAAASIVETVALAEAERRAGDRVAIVAFGERPAIERLPSETNRFSGFDRTIAADGSDLGAALDAAFGLVPDGREAAILVLSDGEENGRDPLTPARRAFARGIRIDAKPYVRPATRDLSVERIDLPERVTEGEPFQFSVWVRADERTAATFSLERADGRPPLSTGERVFEPGLNRLLFRDVLAGGGVAEYAARVAAAGGGGPDRVPENDSARGAVSVAGARSILVVNDDGAEGTLGRALAGAGIRVVTASPESARLDPVALTAHRAIVLENVAASRLGKGGLEAIRDFVLERGGGLLMTGGQASFGVGGYHRSRIDDLLPVSMEMRQEHRKQAVAIAVALDRSGSMAVEAAPGLAKMDLANLGTAAAIELLSPVDQVGVIAVDSAAHVVQELTRVSDPAALASRVRTIEAGGGGIFCHTALLAAGRMLESAEPLNRHVILFADAADAEEQEGCPELIERLRRTGVTISVIALGTEADSDADFLKRVADEGGGTAYFTTLPDDLPRLFAQDTLTAARATFVEERTGIRAAGGLRAMGEWSARAELPSIAGFNRTYLRPDATLGLLATGEDPAPLFAFAHRGLGRTAAYAGQIGGTFGADVAAWPDFAPFFVTVARFLQGLEEPESVFVSARREGASALVTVEIDRDASDPPDGRKLAARVLAPDGRTADVVLEPAGEDRFEGRFPLTTDGITLGTVALGDGRFAAIPPVSLPYSPEFERSPDPERGARTLRRLAKETGGAVDPAAGELFRGERGGRAVRLVARETALAALLLLLLEIAARRLALWGAILAPLRKLRGALPAPRRRPKPPLAAPPSAAAPSAAFPAGRKPAAESAPTVLDALSSARKSAERRLGR